MSTIAAAPCNAFSPPYLDEGMELDALTLLKSLPDFQNLITGVVPVFRGKCSDITLDTPENASLLAQAGFDY